ncbi:cytochrome P450 [Russula earlei]|uniref:Cytochrome P450 n=1 Tax=Russula earlei TaxID=71964 RepID=A0ACC0UIH0_9AGAM|nr:cytochrome P450 [Russula earlei]
MADESLLRTSFLALAGIFVFLIISWYSKKDPLLDAIPTVGFSDPILSYISAIRYYIDGVRMLKEGYQKARPGLFKIATLKTWMVLPASQELVEDIRKAPDDVLSQHEPLEEFIQTTYTLDFMDKHSSYHNDVIRSNLIRNIPKIFQDLYDEMILALDDRIPTTDENWAKISLMPTIQQVICRISNRVFVGTPLCRNHDYQRLNLNFAINVLKSAAIIRIFPAFFKPVVVRVISKLPSQFKLETEFLRPMFEERLAKMKDHSQGDWDDRPNDLLMWFMNEAKGIEKSLDAVIRRMLAVNFAAIHTTSITFTQVLYRLLANPECIEPLRQDVEAAVAVEGWTKAGLDKMHKVDSFVRETQRVDGLGIQVLVRLALRPFTFSNGTTIPAGTLVAAPLNAIHRDEEIYSDPEEFEGFRFAKLREDSKDGMASRHQAGMTSPAHLPFGHGRLACPGRFFAVTEMKALLAHIIVTYDLKLEEGKKVPRQICIASSLIPGNTDILFRKRQK